MSADLKNPGLGFEYPSTFIQKALPGGFWNAQTDETEVNEVERIRFERQAIEATTNSIRD